MRPLNSYLICKELDNGTSETETGFAVTERKRFRKLQVLNSSDEEIKKGDIVKVSINAGEPDEDFTIIKRSDIIYIL